MTLNKSHTYDTSGSRAYFDQAAQIIPTGFNSMGRQRTRGIAFQTATGGHLRDVDGNDYVDTVLGLGPVVIGHGEPMIVEALERQLHQAIILAGESPLVLGLARRLQEWIPCADNIVFSNTGSEAIQVALRVARAATGRERIVKFEGHFHGWLDPTLANVAGAPAAAASGAEIDIVPASKGQVIPSEFLTVARWNDIDHLKHVVSQHRGEIAALIMEPIPLNFGTYLPDPSYLQEVRELCTREGIMLVFDEVVSGFRLGKSGAQGLLGVTPDIAVFAKALGGGVPIAMIAGQSHAMAPLRDRSVGHAGTYNANPMSLAAAEATTRLIGELPDLYTHLDSLGERLQRSLEEVAARHGAPVKVNRVRGVLQLLWDVKGDGRSYQSCATTDRPLVERLCEGLAEFGVYTHPRGMMFLAYRHTEADIDLIASAFQASLEKNCAESTASGT